METTKAFIKALTSFADLKGGSRAYGLDVVRLDGGQLVATDGRRLAVVQGADKFSDPTSFDAKAVRRAAVTKDVVLSASESSLTVDDGNGLGGNIPATDKPYPEWAACVRDESGDDVVIGVDAKYLRDLCDLAIANKTHNAQNPVLRLCVKDGRSSILAQSKGKHDVTAVLMPVTLPDSD